MNRYFGELHGAEAGTSIRHYLAHRIVEIDGDRARARSRGIVVIGAVDGNRAE